MISVSSALLYTVQLTRLGHLVVSGKVLTQGGLSYICVCCIRSYIHVIPPVKLTESILSIATGQVAPKTMTLHIPTTEPKDVEILSSTYLTSVSLHCNILMSLESVEKPSD